MRAAVRPGRSGTSPWAVPSEGSQLVLAVVHRIQRHVLVHHVIREERQPAIYLSRGTTSPVLSPPVPAPAWSGPLR